MRLPRLARWAAALEREAAWLPRLAPRVSLGLSEPVGGPPAGRAPLAELDAETRSAIDALRGVPGFDDGTWARARGYALHQAALIVPYYASSNPAFAAEGVRIVGEVLGGG